MGHLIMSVIAGSWLLATASFGANSPLSLSDIDERASTEAAQAGQAAPASDQAAADYSRYRMEEEANRRLLALSVMATGILSLFLVLMYLKSREAPPDTIVNGSGLVLVIFATVLVVILAKVDQQLTAATGILGAIAGYLFGKSTNSPEAEQKQDKKLTA